MYEDSGLFIGFITVPKNQEIQSFYKKEFENGLFDSCRTKLKNNTRDDKEVLNEYYQPKAFYIFGDFDLAIVTLVDDFIIGSRMLQPGMQDNNHNSHYDYQSSLGIIPSNKGYKRNFSDILKSNDITSKPLLTLTKFKINSGFLIGIGNRITNLIIDKIAEIFKDHTHIVSETFSDNELNLLTLSNSYYEISKLILQVREMQLSDVCDDSEVIKRSYFFQLLENETIKNIENTSKDERIFGIIKQQHLFSYTHSTFGYDLDIHGQTDKFEEQIQNIDNIFFFNHWEVKPGHLKDFIDNLEQENIFKDAIHIPIGKGSLSTKFQNNNQLLPDLFSYLHPTKNIATNINNISEHFNKFKTYLNVTFDKNHLLNEVLCNNCATEHVHLSQYLSRYIFRETRMRELRTKLINLKLSKVLRDRILKMYMNYNDGVQDPLLFTYFIELNGFLEDVYSNISKYLELRRASNKQTQNDLDLDIDSLQEIHKLVGKFVDLFEKAYNNRYQQSNRMINLSDISLEHTGGIQQLISLYDFAFKSIVSQFGEIKPVSIAQVSSYEGVDSIKYGMRLNYFHLFQPELFAAVVTKEAANFITSRMKNDLKMKFPAIYELTCIDKASYMIRKKYRKELHENLEKSIINEENSDLYKFLISSINYNFFNNLLVDVITYNFGYKGNLDLYNFWFWGLFYQNTLNHNFEDKMDFSNVCQMVLRNYFVFLIHNLDQKSILKNGTGVPKKVDHKIRKKYFVPNKIKNSLNDHFISIQKFVESIFILEISHKNKEHSFTQELHSFIFDELIINLSYLDYIKRELKTRKITDIIKNDSILLKDRNKWKKFYARIFINFYQTKIQKFFDIERIDKKYFEDVIEPVRNSSTESKIFIINFFNYIENNIAEISDKQTIDTLIIDFLRLILPECDIIPYDNEQIKRIFYSFRNNNSDYLSILKKHFSTSQSQNININSSLEPSLYLWDIMYHYLKLIKDDVKSDDQFLHRCGCDKKLYTCEDHINNADTPPSKYQFDPLGGIYIPNHEYRKKQTYYRLNLIKIFMDINNKEKLRYLSKLKFLKPVDIPENESKEKE